MNAGRNLRRVSVTQSQHRFSESRMFDRKSVIVVLFLVDLSLVAANSLTTVHLLGS